MKNYMVTIKKKKTFGDSESDIISYYLEANSISEAYAMAKEEGKKIFFEDDYHVIVYESPSHSYYVGQLASGISMLLDRTTGD